MFTKNETNSWEDLESERSSFALPKLKNARTEPSIFYKTHMQEVKINKCKSKLLNNVN